MRMPIAENYVLYIFSGEPMFIKSMWWKCMLWWCTWWFLLWLQYWIYWEWSHMHRWYHWISLDFVIQQNSSSRAWNKMQVLILLQTLMNVQQLFVHTLTWDVWMPKDHMLVVVSKVICGMAQTVLVSSEEVSHWQFWFVYCFVTVWLLTRRFYTGFMLFSLTSVLEVVFLFRVHYICTMNPFFPVEDVCSEENIDCGGGCCIDTLGVASCKCADGFDLSATGICEGEFWTWNPSKEQQLSTWPHTDETCHQLGDRVTKGGSRFIEKYVTSHWHEMRLSASLDSH